MKSNRHMRSWFTHSFRLAVCVAVLMGISLLILKGTAKADAIPKPTMSFIFEYRIEPVAIVEGKLVECKDAACSEQGLPCSDDSSLAPCRIHFECTSEGCFSLADVYADYHRLVITFEDKTRESNVFVKKGFSARYVVTVESDSLSVREVYNRWSFDTYDYIFFGVALVSTLAIELVVAAIYLTWRKQPRYLGWIVVANIVSLPLVWFPLRMLVSLPVLPYIVVAEGLVIAFESVLLYFVGKKKGLSFTHALVLGILMNALSLVLGSVVAAVVGLALLALMLGFLS